MGRVTSMSLADLYANPPAPPVSLWGEGWIVHPSLVVIGAETKVGKSLFAMDLLMALADPARTAWLGAPLATVKRVLYLNEEVPQSGVFARAQLMWGTEGRQCFANFLVPPERGLRFDTDHKAFYEIVCETGADVVCIDPIGRYHTRDENKNQEMGLFLDGLHAAVKRANATVVAVHHFRKAAPGVAESPFQRFRGASRLVGDADSLFTIEKSEGGYVLGAELRHAEWPGLLKLTRGVNLRYELVDAPHTPAHTLLAVQLAGTPRDPHWYRTALENAGVPRVADLIQRLTRTGVLVIEGTMIRAGLPGEVNE